LTFTLHYIDTEDQKNSMININNINNSNNKNETVVVGRLLQRGSMFVFSQSQFQHLLGVGTDWTADTLLDLGIIIIVMTKLAVLKQSFNGTLCKSSKVNVNFYSI